MARDDQEGEYEGRKRLPASSRPSRDPVGKPLPVPRSPNPAAHSLAAPFDKELNRLGATLLPQSAIEAGVTAGTDVVTRKLAGAGAWRTLGLAWREGSPRAGDYRALGPVLAGIAGGAVR